MNTFQLGMQRNRSGGLAYAVDRNGDTFQLSGARNRSGDLGISRHGPEGLSGWFAVDDGEGGVYYVNDITGDVQLQAPGTPVAPAPAPVAAGGSSIDSFLQSITRILPQAVTAYTGYTQAQRIAEVNAQRAARGLPPLTANQAGAYGPQIGVNLAPQTSNMLLYGAIAIGAVLVLSKRRG